MRSRLPATLMALTARRRRPNRPRARPAPLHVAVTRPRSGRGVLVAGSWQCPCALGSSGTIRRKREDDGATPEGTFMLRVLLYRPDRRRRPATALAVEPLGPRDGWCDDSRSRRYNRPVATPFPHRHEALWRADGLYDLVIVLGHNDAPVVAGAGSAIFLHVAKPGLAPTEGCVALAARDLIRLIARTGRHARIVIGPAPHTRIGIST